MQRRCTQHITAIVLLMLLAACDTGTKGGKDKGKAAPVVRAGVPTLHHFIDLVEAVGTARANEQVTLSSPVTERIERIAFDDGGYVRAGQVIATLAQAEERASLAGALAAERQAATQLKRMNALGERGFITPASLDQQTAIVQRNRAEADIARAQITDRIVRAPFAGYASQRAISQGTIVAAGTPIATISDVSRIKLDFTVPETALATMRVGKSVTARAAAFPDTPFHGVVSSIDPVIDPATRAASIRAVLPNTDNRLKPGMLLSVAVLVGEREARAVPELAVLSDGAERYVFVVDRAGKAHRVGVTTGARDAGLVEVRGLAPDARVVTEGVVKVSDGVTVTVARGAGTPRG